MRTHGKQKRRTWRKYHVLANSATHEVTAIQFTEAKVHDCTVLPALLSAQSISAAVTLMAPIPLKMDLMQSFDLVERHLYQYIAEQPQLKKNRQQEKN